MDSSDLYRLLHSPVFAENGPDVDIMAPFFFREGYQNEILFFFKPETFLIPRSLSKRVIHLVQEKFDEYRVVVSGVAAIRGGFLARHGIMERHYGFINELSRNASRMIENGDLRLIKSALGIDRDEETPEILGGHEFLQRFPQYTPESLNDLWFAERSVRVRSGFYVRRCEVEGTAVVLINGFHPLQLLHYTHPKHKIVILLLHSNTAWKVLREEMVGDTYPDKAVKNSIRGLLYADETLRAQVEVSIANNFVHLSAGPFEALSEIHNFLNSLTTFSVKETNVGRVLLAQGLSEAVIWRALRNPVVKTEKGEESLFTVTENLDTYMATALFIHGVELTSELQGELDRSS